MSKPVVAVVVCTLLAMVAAALLVPKHIVDAVETKDSTGAWTTAEGIEEPTGPVEFWWVWQRHHLDGKRAAGQSEGAGFHHRVLWHLVMLEQCLILLLGGGLLTLVVRRERRKRATSP